MALPGDEQPPQDLARGRLRDPLDELDLADPLVVSHALAHPIHQLVGGHRTARDDERLRYLARVLIGAPDNGHVSDRRVREQDVLELGLLGPLEVRSDGAPVDLGPTRLRGCQAEREETSLALFELNAQFAALEPPKPELQALVAALARNQPEADRFVGAVSGTVPVAEFVAAENLASIIGGASGSRAATTEVGVA